MISDELVGNSEVMAEVALGPCKRRHRADQQNPHLRRGDESGLRPRP